MTTYYINRDSLGDTSDEAAERYRHDVLVTISTNSHGTVTAVEWGHSNPSGVWWRFLDTLAAQVWDDNIDSYNDYEPEPDDGDDGPGDIDRGFGFSL